MLKAATLGKIICENRKIIFCGNEFYRYENGFYQKWPDQRLYKHIKDFHPDDYSSHQINEVVNYLKSECFIEIEKVSNTIYLNILSGLLDIKNKVLLQHAPEVLSTIQLRVKYDPNALCLQWLQVLNDIFEGDSQKIGLLQEYFGLCLTTCTKYEKALFMLGEGANGKSVILYILQQMLGENNFSAIPLEKLDSGHYLVTLFGKLANISIETNAKSSVYDSVFKAVVSGDMITADAKFKSPISFRPYCKLIFALNNMPRVDDKTDAFFRRILILRFNRVFKEEEQNKNLKYQLLKEIDGIFLWAIEGYHRLNARGYFDTTSDMKSEVEEYKKDNNNIILFVEDKCELGMQFTSSKDDLYKLYGDWCKENNYFPLAKRKFGKELKKLYSQIDGEERSSYQRLWRGIRKMPFL